MRGFGRGSRELYRPVGFQEAADPLAPRPTVLPWRPPRQMAAYVHPHEDRSQGILIGGHWIFSLLGDGSWYFEDSGEKEPVPDAEATRAEREAALRALDLPRGSVIPYAPKEEKKR
jgi:hypothetical protein